MYAGDTSNIKLNDDSISRFQRVQFLIKYLNRKFSFDMYFTVCGSQRR